MIVAVGFSGSVVVFVSIIAAAAAALAASMMVLVCGHPHGLARPRFATMGAPKLIIVMDATYDGVVIIFVVIVR
jgi:hypothetical protein